MDTDLRLNNWRKQIDELDAQLLIILSERFKLVTQIGILKKENQLPPLDHKRWTRIMDSRLIWGINAGLPPTLIRSLFKIIHIHSLQMQKGIINDAI